jgi:GTPase SAR1 family protein
METFERPALGANIGLGMLYDARTDSFLSESALTMEVQDECTLVDWQESKTVAFCEDDNLASKCETLGLSSSLVASCLAGMVSYEGSGLFLTAKKSAIGDEIVYHALHFATSTVRQQLNLAMVELRASLTDCAPEATHLCTQILFGGCCTITATGSVADPAKRAQLRRKFMDASSLVQEYETHDIDLVALMQVVDLVFDSQLSLTCYSDLPFIGHGRPNISQVKQHLEMMFALNTGAAYGAAKPLQYTMTPIYVVTGDTNSARSVGHLAESELKVAFNVANSFESARSQLAKHLKRLRDNEASVRAEEVLHCHNAIEDVNTAESKFHIALPDILADVRNRVASSTDFKEFIEEFTTGLSSPKRFLSIIPRASGKMNLIDDLRARGATCIKSVDVNQHALSARYAFYFSDVATGHPSWAKNIHLVMQILGNQSALLLAVDCDMEAPPLSKAKVSQLKNGEVVVDDMIERHEREASLCFLKYDPGSVDASMKDAPAQHKSVKISCPGKHCDSATRDWVCQQCRVQVEFGVVDAYFYCDCGRASINSASFHCQQQDHGESYTRFPSKDLQALLQRLPVASEVNVLILGETGVGKSTFINAFINYLSFGTLDEALATKNLNCIIPCSFSTQSEAPDGRLVQNEVRVGQDKDEHDGSKGSSATQDSTVYLIDYAGGRVRLIDTPGIGDTRGRDMDEENLKKILRVLRNYDKLHGILILLKPNNARLTVLFNYTIQELLTQLHKRYVANLSRDSSIC